MKGLKALCLLQRLGFVIVSSIFFFSSLDLSLHDFFPIEDNEGMYQPSFHYYHKIPKTRNTHK